MISLEVLFIAVEEACDIMVEMSCLKKDWHWCIVTVGV